MASDFPEYICKECGRKFRLTSPLWTYRYPKYGARPQYFCRWSCYKKFTDRMTKDKRG